MGIVIGANPGGRRSFAISALFWSGKAPALLIDSRSYSGVMDVLQDIIGVIGEWGELDAAAIAAPLTWSGSSSGWRDCDLGLKKHLPKWAPNSWLRSPNALSGAVAVQGPALTWAMAYEAKRGLLPEHAVFETHPRASLTSILPDMQKSLIGYRNREVGAKTRAKHVAKIAERLVDTGLVRLEHSPSNADELEGMVCALTALAKAYPECGLVTREFEGAPIRPVGKRNLIVLAGLP